MVFNKKFWSADATRRGEAALLAESGVALHLPPHSKRYAVIEC
jgi:hypothetical protein